MNQSYLEVTFRHGKVVAAYFYLPREADQRSARCERVEPGLVVDYDDADRPIGIEITAPRQVSVDSFNDLLAHLGQSPVDARDLSPLQAA